MSAGALVAYQSSRPGSMFPSEGGGYISRGDASSLAGALLELLAEAKGRAEEAERELAQQSAASAQLIERDKAQCRALDHIGGLSRALRSGGPDPMDLQDLSDALAEAVDTAHEALARTGGA